MTLSAIRSRLGSLSPSKLAEIEAVSSCAGKILRDVGLLLRIIGAVQSLLSEENLDLEELACFNVYFILKDALAELESSGSES